MSPATIAAMAAAIELETATDGYAAQMARPPGDTRNALGALLGVESDQIALTDGGTDGMVRLLTSIRFEPGDLILLSPSEFATTVACAAQLRDRAGIDVGVLAHDSSGFLDLDGCGAQLERRSPRLVVASAVPAHRGMRQPVEALTALCRSVDVTAIIDCCQSIGHVPSRWGDFNGAAIVGTGRKWLAGPRGTGFLIVPETWGHRAALGVHPRLIGRESDLEPLPGPAKGAWFERGEYPVAGYHGLGAAVAELLTNASTEQPPLPSTTLTERLPWTLQTASFEHAERFRQTLTEQGWTVLDDSTGGPTAIVGAVPPDGIDPAQLVVELRDVGIACSSMTKADSPLDPGWGAHAAVLRLSPSGSLTEEDIAFVERTLLSLADS
jgi:pyridoxal 5-phosphate dependent beta-lyase